VNDGKISAYERKEGQMLHHERSQWANNLIEPYSVRSNTVIGRIMPYWLANGKPDSSGTWGGGCGESGVDLVLADASA
jgi:hypothetical protein